jgi:hypothetical protein
MVRGLLLPALLMLQFAVCGALESRAATLVEGEHPNELQTAQQAVVVSTGGWDDIHWDAATIRAEREQLEESRAPGVHCAPGTGRGLFSMVIPMSYILSRRSMCSELSQFFLIVGSAPSTPNRCGPRGSCVFMHIYNADV